MARSSTHEHTLRSLLPFAFGFLIWLTAGVELALIWFMAYYLFMSLRQLLLKRQPQTPPSVVQEPVIRIIDPERSDEKEYV